LNIKDINSIYFVGIGGIGMSAIARYFNSIGKYVCGYDLTPTELTETLEKEGIDIHYNDDISLIPDKIKENKNVLVVYTPAIPTNHSELNYFKNNNFTIYKRAEILGLITKDNYTIAVAGTHGKTTISSMIVHIFKYANIPINAFVGGISMNYNSNFVLSKDSKYTIVEADEFDKSFLTLSPDIAIVSSVDADHLDIYGNLENLVKTFGEFTSLVKPNGQVILKRGIDLKRKINNCKTYSIKEKAEYCIDFLKITKDGYVFDFIYEKNDAILEINPKFRGIHNIENSVVAMAVAKILNIDNKTIKEAIESYKGVKRRFEYIVNKENLVFIDDYAHHPNEINALIHSVKGLYPGKRILGIFQPHLYSRTNDFMDNFANVLSNLDEVILLDIYPARELPMEGVTSEKLLEKIKNKDKKLLSKQDLLKYIENNNIEVILTIGAGDIDKLVNPIKEILNKKC